MLSQTRSGVQPWDGSPRACAVADGRQRSLNQQLYSTIYSTSLSHSIFIRIAYRQNTIVSLRIVILNGAQPPPQAHNGDAITYMTRNRKCRYHAVAIVSYVASSLESYRRSEGRRGLGATPRWTGPRSTVARKAGVWRQCRATTRTYCTSHIGPPQQSHLASRTTCCVTHTSH